MQLDDAAGCPGSFSATKGATRPFCFNCDRYHKQAPNMLQPAAMLVEGQWHCVNRRSGGVHGEVDCAPASGQGEPLDLGKVATTAGAGVANIGTHGASA